ncbi:hypothetical protein M3Y97_00184800 [Aphelenchoides bicaudatus]|nr:hypothetical protein M3Y97_00184800 [Aphelenchoides bicaudatus]
MELKSYYCFRIHVHKWCFLISILTAIHSLATLSLCVFVFVKQYKQKWLTNLVPKPQIESKYVMRIICVHIIEAALLLIVSIMLAFGNKTRRPTLYFNFLVALAASLVLTILRLAFSTFMLFKVNTKDENNKFMFRVFLITAIVSGILFVVGVCFLTLVKTGRDYILRSGQPQQPKEKIDPNQKFMSFNKWWNRSVDQS